ncbi:MAG: T9SS type A sorting domain-containing protein [Chitinophagaceae bacterium]
MKTVLRSVLLLAALAFVGKKADAQCTVSDLIIQNIVPQGTQTAGSCTASFDLSFTMQNNNGNKFIFIHVWPATTYPDFFDCQNGEPGGNGAIHPPESGDLIGSFINIGINNNGALPVLLSSYPPDGAVVLNSAISVTSSTQPDGSVAFVVHGVVATFPVSCNTPFLMTADLWSSQSAGAQVAQCVNCHIDFAINFMSLTGFANCANLTYNATLTNRIGSALSGYYQVYADANFDGVLSLSSDSLIRDTTAFSLAASVGATFPITGAIPPVNINQDLFVILTITSGVGDGSVTVFRLLSTVCAPLPVTFGTFTAKRINNSSVNLRWETYTEINNNGFVIERNMGNGWEIVGNVPTQSANSTSLLVYTFTDINTSKNATQYRIRQVDIDNRSRYSEIRIVRGFGQNSGLIVYPNPSHNGMVNVVFDEKDITRDVSLTDARGGLVKQWKSISSNTLIISGLQPGFYNLRVQERGSGNQTVAKIIIAGRTE